MRVGVGHMRKQKTIHYKQKKPCEKMEFSKLIYILNLSFVAIVTGLSFLCVIMSEVDYAKEKDSTALQA